MFPTLATPPDDLDRIALAWLRLQQLVNLRLPYYAGQMIATRRRIAK